MSIQLFTPHFRVEECLAEIRECLEKGWTGLGYKTVEFESQWGEYTGLPHSHFVASNTVGLHLALYIYKTDRGWEAGDEVITTPLTFVSSNHAIRYCELNPVFADVDEYLCLDPRDIERKITSRTRAVMFVGLGGNAGRLEEVADLCRRQGLVLVLDAAHMAGTRLNSRHVGLEADCTVFSFQAVKNLPTADSGMVCFGDHLLDGRARKLSWLGINKDTFARTSSQGAYKWMYDVEEVGFKYHGNSIMASLGLVALRYLDRDNAYRRQLAAWYSEQFASVTEITCVPIAPNCESARHLFQICVKDRDAVMNALQQEGVYAGVHYRDNTEYAMYTRAAGTCPNAHNASQRIISLPMHMGVTQNDINRICGIIKRVRQ